MKVQLAALAASYVQVTRAVADLQKKITLVSTQSSAPAASALPKCSTPTSFLPPTKKRKTSKPKAKGSFPQPRTHKRSLLLHLPLNWTQSYTFLWPWTFGSPLPLLILPLASERVLPPLSGQNSTQRTQFRQGRQPLF